MERAAQFAAVWLVRSSPINGSRDYRYSPHAFGLDNVRSSRVLVIFGYQFGRMTGLLPTR